MKVRSPFDQLSDYEIRQLPSHLLETREYRTLHRLLELEDSNCNNAWFEAKSRLGETSGYVADVEGAWEVAEREDLRSVQTGEPVRNLALELRYAFITAALASLAELPCALIGAFVQRGLWTPQQAVAHAWQITSWSGQLSAVAALARVLDGELRRSCEQRVLQLIENGRAEFPSRTSSSESSDLSTSDNMLCGECLDSLSETLPESQVEAGVKAARQIGNLFWRIHGLRNLGLRLSPQARSALAAELWQKASQMRSRFLRAEASANLAPLFFQQEERDARIAEALREAVDVLGDVEARKMLRDEPRSGVMMISHHIQEETREYPRPLRVIALKASDAQLQAALRQSEQMEELPLSEAFLVLLPEIAKRGMAVTAMQRAQALPSPIFRNLIKAEVAQYLNPQDQHTVLQQVVKELAEMEELEVRLYSLSLIAIHLGPGDGLNVIREVLAKAGSLTGIEAEPLGGSTLRFAARAIEGCPAEDRPSLAREFLQAGKGSRERGRNDSVLTNVVPWLDAVTVEEEFRQAQKIAFGRKVFRIRQHWSAEDVRALTSVAASDAPLDNEWIREAFAGASKLSQNQRARLLIIAAPRMGPDMLPCAMEAAQSIENKHLQSRALYALAAHAPEALRGKLALETLQSVWQRSGGLQGAGPMLEEMVAAAAGESRPALFQAWSAFVRSLARSSWNTMLDYLQPNARVMQVLGDSGTVEEAVEGLEAVERWWGKSSQPSDKDPPEEECTSDDLVPYSTRGSVAAIIDILVEAQQFERAQFLLEALQGMPNEGGAATLEEISNTLLYGLAAAGKLDGAMNLLPQISRPSLRSLEIVVRQLIAYGRTDKAHDVLNSVGTVFGAEAALPLAALIEESYLAEDRLTDALEFFERLPHICKAGRALDSYTDIAFMLGNAFLRRSELKRADKIVLVLKEQSGTLGGYVGSRLVELSSGVRDAARANYWKRAGQRLAKTSGA